MPLKYKYNPGHFNPISIEHAKKLILSDISIPDQWETETEWTIDFFRKKNLFNEESIVLDWGCGIGRLSKPIIEQFNCKVIGVDFQPNMLKYATEYVNHPNFTAISNEEFSELPEDYFTVGIAVWALMHTTDTVEIIKHIHKKLQNKSKFCVLDASSMTLPVVGVEQCDVSMDDDVFDVPVNKENGNEDIKWVLTPSSASLSEMQKHFFVEEIGPLSSKKTGHITLSKYFDNSWSGIFINDKKNNKTYFYI